MGLLKVFPGETVLLTAHLESQPAHPLTLDFLNFILQHEDARSCQLKCLKIPPWKMRCLIVYQQSLSHK